MLIFEHPLNERMRTLLRVEYLINQLHSFSAIDGFNNALSFFHLFSDLLDILDRIDVRTELQKGLEARQQRMLAWRETPGVDLYRLEQLINQLTDLSAQLGAADRFGRKLREDRILASIRRRISIPGGYFTFDSPLFYMWLNTPQTERDRHVAIWLNELSLLNDTLSVYMQFLRQGGQFQAYECQGLFHRDNFGEYDLLRVQVPAHYGVYPQISGNQTRYALRFTPYDESKVIDKIEFELTCC